MKKRIMEQWADTDEMDLNTNEHIAAYRELHSGMGTDAEKMIPAVEAMLKRGIMKNKFPSINSLVDLANITSLENLIPIGIFDYDQVEGDIELSLSSGDDTFIPIGSRKGIKLPENTPILTDDKGVFSAVGHRDSVRTMISPATKNIIAFSWGIDKIEPGVVEKTLRELNNKLRGGTTLGSEYYDF